MVPNPSTASRRRESGRGSGGRLQGMGIGPATAVAAVLLAACSGSSRISTAQRVVLPSGVRIEADVERLQAINDWTHAQLQRVSCRVVVRPRGADPDEDWDPRTGTVRRSRTDYCLFGGTGVGGQNRPGVFRRSQQDPRIHMRLAPGETSAYPWSVIVIEGDTVQLQVPRGYPDAEAAYGLYAYLQLLATQGRIEEALPDAAGAEGYELDRMMVERVADAWLLARAGLGLDPFPTLDELVVAREAGWLDAFLFVARPRAFRSAREAWMRENPGALEAYRSWFMDTMGEEPPGLRTPTGG